MIARQGSFLRAVAATIHRFRLLVVVVWLLLGAAGAVAAPRAVDALTYDSSRRPSA